MKKLLLLLLFTLNSSVFTLMAQEYRDVVFLKNGSVIKGFYKEIVSGDSLHIETLDGSKIIIPYDAIKRIAKEKTDVYVMKEAEMIPARKWRPKGYQGFVEYSYGIYIDDTKLNYTTLSTIHGYQFSRHLFLGLGVALSKFQYKYDKYIVTPQDDSFGVLANAKWYVLHTNIAPVVDLRGGYNITGGKSLDASAGIGVDFGLTPRFGLFVTVNYNYCHLTKNEYDMAENQNFINLRVGLHF